jgi:excisionase family DNA binding protein
MELREWSGPKDLAEWLDLPVATIYRWRHTGIGPPAVRVGKHLRYRRRDVERWLAEQADPRPAA